MGKRESAKEEGSAQPVWRCGGAARVVVRSALCGLLAPPRRPASAASAAIPATRPHSPFRARDCPRPRWRRTRRAGRTARRRGMQGSARWRRAPGREGTPAGERMRDGGGGSCARLQRGRIGRVSGAWRAGSGADTAGVTSAPRLTSRSSRSRHGRTTRPPSTCGKGGEGGDGESGIAGCRLAAGGEG